MDVMKETLNQGKLRRNLNMKIFSSIVLAAVILISAASTTAQACDKAAARKVLSLMNSSMVYSVSKDAGWVIVTFGNDYFSWTDRQCEAMVTAYANADACITGKARSLEFRSPSGKLIARADSFRGIKMIMK
jgi:hypothetical protein